MTSQEAALRLPPAFLVVLAGLSFGVVGQGGYRSHQFIPMAVAIGTALLVALLRDGRRLVPAPVTGLVALLAGPVLVSGFVTGASRDAIVARLALIGVVAAALAIGTTVPTQARGRAADCLTGLALLVAVTGWWGAVNHREPWGFLADGLWRASSTLTYPNAAAAVVGPLLAVNLARLAARGGRARALVVTLLATGLVATQSRAGVGATACGILLLAHLVGWRRAMRAWLMPAIGVAVAALALLATSPPDGGGAAPARWAWLGLAVGAGLTAAVPQLHGRALFAAAGRRPLVVLVGLALAAGALLVVTASGDRWADVVASRLSLSSPVAGGEASGERPLLGDRGRMWSAAWEGFSSAPLFGTGPGNLTLSWTGADGQTYVGLYAHNEYLELAASQGLAGLAGLVAAVAVLAKWVRRSGSANDELNCGTIAALVTFGLHSGTDFLWRLPVLPVIAALLTGITWARASRDPESAEPQSAKPESGRTSAQIPCSPSATAGPHPSLLPR